MQPLSQFHVIKIAINMSNSNNLLSRLYLTMLRLLLWSIICYQLCGCEMIPRQTQHLTCNVHMLVGCHGGMLHALNAAANWCWCIWTHCSDLHLLLPQAETKLPGCCKPHCTIVYHMIIENMCSKLTQQLNEPWRKQLDWIYHLPSPAATLLIWPQANKA